MGPPTACCRWRCDGKAKISKETVGEVGMNFDSILVQLEV
jgi:hypothetical protein